MSNHRGLGHIQSVSHDGDGTLVYAWKPNRRGRRFAERWNRRGDRAYRLIAEMARHLSHSQPTLSNQHQSQEDTK